MVAANPKYRLFESAGFLYPDPFPAFADSDDFDALRQWAIDHNDWKGTGTAALIVSDEGRFWEIHRDGSAEPIRDVPTNPGQPSRHDKYAALLAKGPSPNDDDYQPLPPERLQHKTINVPPLPNPDAHGSPAAKGADQADGGTPFGRYRLIALLGRGGMGEVWRAYDTAANNRTVAIKVLPANLANDSSFVRRFRREAEAAAQLNNPHVIPIHNYGEIEGRLYVDMRLVEGRDLQEVLNAGPLEPGRAVRIIEQVARALQAAHKVGLVHRDVKPSNILVDDDDFAYLIDFGIARGADQTNLTSAGDVIGSLHYMAPERLRAQEADARADIYALACVLYECLTGSRPFPGDSMESQMAAHLTNPPPQPSTRHDVPAQLDMVIARGMAKNPEQRYTTTIELANAARDAITAPIQRPTGRTRVAGTGQPDSAKPGIPPYANPPAPPWSAPPWSGPQGPGPQGPAPPVWATDAKGNRRTTVALVVGGLVILVVVVAVVGLGIFFVSKYWPSRSVATSPAFPTFQGSQAIPTGMPSFSIPSFPGHSGSASGAKVIIDGKDQKVSGMTVCIASGGDVVISIGGAGTGIAAVLDDADPPGVKSVSLGIVNGVQLVYSAGSGQGNASATKNGRSYKITGNAAGMDIANPGQPVTKSFDIDVTCS
jgi:serine/threonine protein kinase